jgi:hypothetical protein
MLQYQASLLLINLKSSYIALFGILLAFLTPIVPLILLVGVAIGFDTVSGIMKAKKLKTYNSRGLSQICSKMCLYETAIIFLYCVEKYITGDFIGLLTDIPLVLTKLTASYFIFIEASSIDENYKAITGKSLWGKFKFFLRRTKEVSHEVKNVLNEKND